ncbi:hypothetical protein [Bosea sp. PAMC 26642]|uniref:hypothetical protein n=1 Tax=Bosea sp. (strain PAMC 26642) TaxID=1792307 RepID=UPI0007706CE0|nr:hypothetical protein [Bosea sp. PAMC 26642]AMJ62035.1 hypothetical protein AXW83_18565 [Bosea sp. PAMC 26642]
MHTIKVIGGGFALLGLLLVLMPRLSISGADPIAFAVKVFIPLWLVATLINLWVGVSKAGYTVAEEAPIGLVVFGVPAIAALLILWIVGRTAG